MREAFDHAIDRKQIIDVVFLGTAKPGVLDHPAATGDWSNPDRQADGVRPRQGEPDPRRPRLQEGLGRDPRRERPQDVLRGDHADRRLTASNRTFQIIQPDFRKIGVQLTQKSLDSTAAFDAMTAPDDKYPNFDLALWDWTALIDPDFMLSVVTCDQYGGWSDTGFCDKSYDAMYSKQQLTPDQAKRRDVVWKMQKYLYDEEARTSGSPH